MPISRRKPPIAHAARAALVALARAGAHARAVVATVAAFRPTIVVGWIVAAGDPNWTIAASVTKCRLVGLIERVARAARRSPSLGVDVFADR